MCAEKSLVLGRELRRDPFAGTISRCVFLHIQKIYRDVQREKKMEIVRAGMKRSRETSRPTEKEREREKETHLKKEEEEKNRKRRGETRETGAYVVISRWMLRDQ